jgi:hypothetical protein
MSGGDISGNTSGSYGGGVYVSSGTFIKQSGGIIYGWDASDSLKNTAASRGHAVYVSSAMQRNNTVGEGVFLDSGKSGSAGGWAAEAHVTLQIDLQPVTTPPLSSASVSVNQEAQFSPGSGYSAYTWYWDGDEISGEASSTYTLAAGSKAPGIYELSVFVNTSAGKLLSARCRVTITSY